MTDAASLDGDNRALEKAVAEGGAYEVIKGRLEKLSSELKTKVEQLNQARIDEFGQTQLEVAGRARVRTENNCLARDIARVGDYLVFGYNVFIGLKKETNISDVFSLYKMEKSDEGFEIVEQPIAGSFLSEESFAKEFHELYTYYKDTKLIQLLSTDQKLFAVFQIGRELSDIRVFQWQIDKEGQASYIDNRGERSFPKPQPYDFEWTQVGREQHVSGKHPHISILDKVFVETINGDFTIKVEDNTEDGLGIYQEPVEDKNQSLADADISYAEVGVLILLRVTPYRERHTRYFVFNTRNNQVDRIDAIAEACIQLPEDHGIIFPGGYYLQNGETKSFPDSIDGLKFKRVIHSPNGEDVLYVFYEPNEGIIGLYSYNLIRKELQNPICSHGYTLFEDGTAVLFNAEPEATRIHPMQIWQTPYYSQQFAAEVPSSQSFYSKIGNRELVRGIAELGGISRSIADPNPSRNLYEDLINTTHRLFDAYFWLESDEVDGIGGLVKNINKTAELIIDEFEKVESIRLQATKSITQAEQQQQTLLTSIRPEDWNSPEQYISCLGDLRQQRGHLITLKDQRYIDLDKIVEMDEALAEAFDKLSQQTVNYLAADEALQPYADAIKRLTGELEHVEQIVAIKPILEQLGQQSDDLDLLTEILNTLKVEDTTVRTKILDDISEIYGKLNQVKAKARIRHKEIGSGEASAEFAAQFRLFSQSITSALSMVDSPDKADEQLSRLLIQLEELESKFSEYDQFLDDTLTKREELHDVFESRKQSLIEQRQKRAHSLGAAAERILQGILRRSGTFAEPDLLNTYFASDPMVLKVAELVEQLRELEDQVRADDVEAQLKSAKEQAIRGLRDKQDIFENGGAAIKLGKHKFSVNSQELDLTLLTKDGQMLSHLIGTDYYEPVQDDELYELQAYWNQSLISENQNVSRAEYLAYQLLDDAAHNRNDQTLTKLQEAAEQDEALLSLVRKFTEPKYQEGYEKGIHDVDASQLIKAILPVQASAGLLSYAPKVRSLAALFWARSASSESQKKLWIQHAKSAYLLNKLMQSKDGFDGLRSELSQAIAEFSQSQQLPYGDHDCTAAAEYLSLALSNNSVEFVLSQSAQTLTKQFLQQLKQQGQKLEEIVSSDISLTQSFSLIQAWLQAFIDLQQAQDIRHYISEAAAYLLCQQSLRWQSTAVSLDIKVSGLLSEHANIEQGNLSFSLDEFNARLFQFSNVEVPSYNQYQQLRHDVMLRTKKSLGLDSFKAKPLSSFVRNKLINEVYLPIIGDNLAKQMGTLGDNKRTDLMGLLLLISPPGYGKTTLMEYVADRLGLIFMKINCPSLGHDVTSIDPTTAPNATARQELEKLNLALEMGNNVMLYLDDIQHTHPEFLQKFISLCDGTRRIEGVWKGESKTYDMRGKKFCVIMSGNPYTESGDVFKIPDMLANRADIYNLGDILGGKDQQFALSYIENALTSNAVLNQLALRDMQDVYRFVAMAQGEQVASTDFSHDYSSAEINEITSVLQRLLTIQEVILKINLQYIESAAQADQYRTEPAFKLQGSYRNMNKMAEKVSAVMDEAELMQLIGDHYIGEAQTLTSGAEENLLKLAQLRGTMTAEEEQRWLAITSAFQRNKDLGENSDPTAQAVSQLAKLAQSVQDISGHFGRA